MLRVEYDGRIDDETMRCRIWFSLEGGSELTIVVPVRATKAEVPEPQRAIDPPNYLDMEDVPRLPWHIRLRAVAVAQAFTDKFGRLQIEPDFGGG
jgi:hypothetical protein